MKTLTTDKIAAKLYLEIWQTVEGMPEHIDPTVGIPLIESNKTKLKEMGYPPNPIYDNEGCAVIFWGDPNFDCEEYYQCLLNNQ